MSYVVAGYGKFGRLALKRLTSAFPSTSVMVVEESLDRPPGPPFPQVSFFRGDAVSFLLRSPVLQDDDVIIPTVPFHLTAAYLLSAIPSSRAVLFPSRLVQLVPNPYALDQWNLFSSHAHFVCPDECPGEACCTVTGEVREPLFSIIAGLNIPGFTTVVLESKQILPGVGGYHLRELKKIVQAVRPGKNILATACQCHGVMTALEV
jgi:hypothetical protein